MAFAVYGHEVKILALSNNNKSFKNGDDYFIKSFPAFYYPGMRMSFAKKVYNDAIYERLNNKPVRKDENSYERKFNN